MKTFLTSLRKHPGTAVLITALCWAAAAVYHYTAPVLYVSEAKVMIRYLNDEEENGADKAERRGAVVPRGPRREGVAGVLFGDIAPRRPPQSGDAIMLRQKGIVTSPELAEKAAAEFGAVRLAASGDLKAAAAVVMDGLTVSLQPGTSVMHLAFRHPNVKYPQAVLRAVLKVYYRRHVEQVVHSVEYLEMNRRVELSDDPPSNLVAVQKPTPAVPDTAKRNRIIAGLLAGGPLLGLLAAGLRGRPAPR